MRLDREPIGDLMNLSIQSYLCKGMGGTLHRKLDLRHHQGTGLCHFHPISPLTFQSIGPHLLHLSMDTHALGIIPILLSLGHSLQNTCLDPMSLGNHLRSVLINAIGTDTSLHIPIEIKDIEITIRRNRCLKASKSKPLPSMINWTQPNFWIGWQIWTITLSGMIYLKRDESGSLR